MALKNRHLDSVNGIDWGNKILGLGAFCLNIIKAIGHGIKSKTLPVKDYLFYCILIELVVILHVDLWLFKITGYEFLYPTKPFFHWIYRCFALCSPFLLWGFWQALVSIRHRSRLTNVFLEAGLKSNLGKLPGFIFDWPLDEDTRKLRLTKSSLTEKQFKNAQASLQSSLQVKIDEFKDDTQRGTIDIIYAFTEMPSRFNLDVMAIKTPDTFSIGKTRSKEITAKLSDIPHWLIAGQSQGGKSTFVRQTLTTLYLKNPTYQFLFIDLKGGLESETFEKTKRILVAKNTKEALEELEKLPLLLEQRMELFRSNGWKDIDDYLKLSQSKKSSLPEIGRHIIIVDEAAELLLSGEYTSGTQAQKAKQVLSQLTRQGRAVGFHVFIATQRPDATAVASQVKANLSGVICYQTPNDATSITIIGNGRATELPSTKGRAIFKNGPNLIEVQTPIIETDHVKELLKDYRSESKPAEEISQTHSKPSKEKLRVVKKPEGNNE